MQNYILSTKDFNQEQNRWQLSIKRRNLVYYMVLFVTVIWRSLAIEEILKEA
jgi:hypothetical protein